MMRSILVLGVSALAIGACGGGNGKVRQACTSIMADPDPAEELADNNVSIDAFCDCLVAQLDERPDGEAERLRTTMISVAPGFEEGRSGEDIYRELREKAQSEDATQADEDAYRNMDDLGEFLEDVIDSMAGNNRTCPVPADA